MPELPDLQVFSRNLEKQLRGKKLKKLDILYDRKLKTSKARVKKALEDTVLERVYRSGKELRFLFSNDRILGMHLMLRGALELFEGKPEQKHAIAALYFEDDIGLVLKDFQKAAHIQLDPEEKEAPDALSKELNYPYLKGRLSRTGKPVKTVIMDQSVIRGIGNAYADEILWKAGISPFSASKKIPDTKIRSLVKAIPAVLKQAEKNILKKDPDRISGELRDFLKIHNAKKKQSPTGALILHADLNSRK
ncbi:MAG TPA: DNA-formamidopyrimidine glycosylase family protein, partial [Chitinophagaceae bacterium]|nr:DNA-formamidopyrimidine glycosylase family protein [Chitinophagaceae bacterium]